MKSFLHTVKRNAIAVLMMMLVLGVSQSGWGQTRNGTLAFGNPTDGTTATTANTGFGGVRVGTGGGTITIANAGQEIGTQGELKLIAPTTASINSVGITSTEFGTAATAFTVSFEVYLSGGSSGTMYFFAGNGTSFGSAQSNGFTGADVFTGIRWVFGASNAITTNNRNAGAWDATGLSGTPFAQNTSYTVTVVGNNSAATISNYDGNSNNVASGKYDLWINGVLVGDDLGKALLAASTSINAFRFYGESSTGNVATINVDNVRWWNSCIAPSMSVYSGLTSVPAGNYTDLNINSGSGTLAGNASVNGILTLTNNLDINAKTLTLTSGSNGAITGTGARSITSTGNGTISVTTNNIAISGVTSLSLGSTVTLQASKGVDFGSSLTTVNGTFQINANGFANNNAPIYGSSSSLIYNVNGSYGVGTEWTGNSTTAGTGVPNNVTIQNSSAVTMPNGANLPRGMAGSLSISSGSLTLGNNSTNNDIYVAGNWTRASAATFTPNGRAVFFNGSGTQTVTVTGSGTETFNFLLVQGSGTLKLATSTDATNVTVNSASGLTLSSSNATSTIDLNGQTMTVSGGGSINLNTGARKITSSTGTGTFAISTSNLALSNPGNILFGDAVSVLLTTGMDFGNTAIATIGGGASGRLQINANGFVNNSGAPTFAANSTLLINTGSFFDLNNGSNEAAGWFRNVASTGSAQRGIPWNLTIGNNTSLRYNTANTDNNPRYINGSINIGSGSAFTLGGINVTAGDFYLRGNWTRAGTFTPNSRGVFFNGTGTQVIAVTGGGTETYDYFIDANTGGSVQLSSSPATDVTVQATTASPVIFSSTGTLDLNGRTFTISGSGGNIDVGTVSASITSSTAATLAITGAKTVTSSTGTLSTGSNVTVAISAGVNFGASSKTTINGTLQINTGGSCSTSSPNYGSGASLIYATGDYNTSNEWIAGGSVGLGVPSNVTISLGSGANTLSLSGSRSVVGALALTTGNIAIGSNTLTLNGAVTNTTGALNGTSSSILSLGGSSAQSLAFATGASLASLNVAKTSGTSTLSNVGDTLRIFTGIDFTGNTSGVLDLNGKEIKMKSNSTATAYIGQSSISSLTGATAITVERFIPQNSNRAWRLLSVATTGGQTIKSAWQNGQASGVAGPNGLGTWITSNVGGATGLGYDAQTPGNSMLGYDQTNNLWAGVTSNTGTTQLSPSGTDGYMLYVRGDRQATNGNSTITPTTLFSRGGIRQNNQSAITVPAKTGNPTGTYVMIGNPFASTINLPSLTSTGFTAPNSLNVSVWDPQKGSIGAFVVLQYDGTNYTVQTSGSTTYGIVGTIVNTIQSGQAFFVESQVASGTLAIPESAKRTTSSNVFRQTALKLPAKRYLFTDLYAGQDSAARNVDGTVQYFDPSFSNLVDYADAGKLGNFSENLGISKGAATLSVEKRGAIAPADTIFFSISNMKIQGYQLRFIAAKLTQPGVRAFLEDSYLHSSTPVALNDTTTVNFSVDANAGSYASNRFRLVFKTRPVAIANNNTGTDGLSAVSNGTTKSISVYPNPVTGGIVNISFKNEPAGNYQVMLYTMKGQPLFTKTMSHAGGNAAQSLLIGKGIANGSYKLAVIHPDNTRTEQTIIVTK